MSREEDKVRRRQTIMQTMFTYRQSMSLRFWEGLEEAQVSGLLHLRQGQSWRSQPRSHVEVTSYFWALLFSGADRLHNRTQEDLSSTSQRLARLETLLTEIMPLVEPRVQEMIHQARREQVRNFHPNAKKSRAYALLQEQIGSADSPESEVSSHIGASASSMLPQTHANVFPQGRLPSLPNVFDPARPVSGASGNIPLIHRISGNEQSLDRLPSITASGMLIERDRLAALQRIRSPEAPNIRPSMSPTQADYMMEAGTSIQSPIRSR